MKARIQISKISRSWWAMVSLVFLLVCVGCTALAQQEETQDDRFEEANRLVKEGMEYSRQKDWKNAALYFEKADSLYSSPEIRFNLALTYRELGRVLDARRTALSARQDVGAGDPLAAELTSFITKLETKLGRLSVTLSRSPESRDELVYFVDGERVETERHDDSSEQAIIWLTPGQHTLRVTATQLLCQEETTQVRPAERSQLELRCNRKPSKPDVSRTKNAATYGVGAGLVLSGLGMGLTLPLGRALLAGCDQSLTVCSLDPGATTLGISSGLLSITSGLWLMLQSSPRSNLGRVMPLALGSAGGLLGMATGIGLLAAPTGCSDTGSGACTETENRNDTAAVFMTGFSVATLALSIYSFFTGSRTPVALSVSADADQISGSIYGRF